MACNGSSRERWGEKGGRLLWGTAGLVCSLSLMTACFAGAWLRRASMLQSDALSTPAALAYPQMKHLIIDKVYFPKNREDAGVASVHGWVNGKFVEGNLHVLRTAKYNAEDGSWSGVPNLPPRAATYKPAVESVVSRSILAAMRSLLSPKKPALKLTAMGADPQTALTREIAKATHQAVDEVLAATAADRAVSKLKAKKAPSMLHSVKNRLRAKTGGVVKTLKGCACRHTYIFEGEVHHGCTRRGGERAWCYTVGDCGFHEGNGKSKITWDHCELPLITTVKGCQCDLPFDYQGEKQHACVDSSRTFLWGPAALSRSGHPRGIWCKTKGDCGAGELKASPGDKWDHCELPPTAADTHRLVQAMSQRLGPTRPAASGAHTCGATVGDFDAHRQPIFFSSECRSGACAWRCSDPHYCPSCAGGNCKCTPRLERGAKCGLRSNRPPEYSSYLCQSRRCVFEHDETAEAPDCNDGKCKCA